MTWTLVTGGAKRLGAEICYTLAHKKQDIIVHYRNSRTEALQVVKSCCDLGVQADCIQGDFSTFESTEAFLNELQMNFKGIRNLINNVGNYPVESAVETPSEAWNELFQVNLHAPFACIQALLPQIKKAQGNIINIGVSGITMMRAAPSATAYRATKMGLLMLTKSLGRELAPYGVRVNMVSPGQLKESIDVPQDLSQIPMHRLGNFKEVARVVAFLMDPESEYITGQNIEVAGGLGL